MGAREELGARLRQLRRERGISGTELAEGVGVSQGTVSKTERGHLVPDLDYLAKFAHLLRLSRPEAAELMSLAGVVPDGAAPESLLQHLPVDFLDLNWAARRQETVALAETRSSQIRSFQPLYIPGLLQTEEYARHVLRIAGISGTRAVERALRARLRRQKALVSPGKRFIYIMTEAAVIARLAPSDVLKEELRHLCALAGLPHVRIGLIPQKSTLPVLLPPAFHLFEGKVHVELPHGDLWLNERAPGFERYTSLFDDLKRIAVFGAQGVARLEQLIVNV